MTLEGVDFSGKSTLVVNLKRLLEERGFGQSVYFTREPGGTVAAERIRELVLDPVVEMNEWTEAYLYAAARADHVRCEILPRLLRGEWVFCERFLDSSLAYQGGGRGLGVEEVRALNALAVRDARPDITFYLKLEREERELRAKASRSGLDRLERAGGDFMERAAEVFERLAAEEPERITALDATRPPLELAAEVYETLASTNRPPAN